LGIFNITQSVAQKRTVLDTVFDFSWRKNFIAPFIFVFRYDDSTVLARQQPAKITLDSDIYSLPQYLKINHKTNETERTYTLYADSVYNPDAHRLNEEFYLTFDLISPDRQKIAMCMKLLAQINILDLNTGKVQGIRIKHTPGFDYLKGNVDDYKYYYHFLDVDEKYIYALYVDKKYAEVKESVNSQIIHVFDWNGNFVRKLFVDEGLDFIKIDAEKRLMYGTNLTAEKVFRYKLPF
jgi:hypothetical protein